MGMTAYMLNLPMELLYSFLGTHTVEIALGVTDRMIWI